MTYIDCVNAGGSIRTETVGEGYRKVCAINGEVFFDVVQQKLSVNQRRRNRARANNKRSRAKGLK